MVNTDKAWEHFGREDPYYGVLTNDAFTKDKIDDAARDVFFQSGEDYVDFILSVVRDHLDPTYEPTRALDFGCGVGRVTLALARRTSEAVGVDVSAGMIDEAVVNASESKLSNVRFAISDDRLSQVGGTFDLINSCIVFQHIATKRGVRFLRRLLDCLRDDGIGVIQMTYANASSTPVTRRILTSAYERIPFAFALRNVVKRERPKSPQMHMNRYDLSTVLRVLQEHGCHDIHVRFTEASHYNYPIYGVILFFKKHPLDVSRYS